MNKEDVVYYTQRKLLLSPKKKSEILPFATWMNLEGIRNKSESERQKPYAETDTHTHRKGKKIKQRQTQRQGTDWSLPEEKVVRAG